MILQRNRLDSLIKNTRVSLVEFGASLPSEQREAINGILNQAEEILRSESIIDIKAYYSNVEFAANQLTESLMAAI